MGKQQLEGSKGEGAIYDQIETSLKILYTRVCTLSASHTVQWIARQGISVDSTGKRCKRHMSFPYL